MLKDTECMIQVTVMMLLIFYIHSCTLRGLDFSCRLGHLEIQPPVPSPHTANEADPERSLDSHACNHDYA